MKKYNEFLIEQEEALNEGIFDALKSVMKFFKGVNQTLQTNIGNFTKKLDASKNWQDTLTNINTMVIQPNTKYFEENMKTATTVSQIRKINYEVHLSTFTELNATYKKWDATNPKSPINPAVMFTGTPFANMYNFQDTESFTKNLPNAVNGLVSTYAKTAGYPMEDVTKSINDYKDLTQNPPAGTEKPAETTTPEKPATQPVKPVTQPVKPPVQNNVSASYTMSFSDFKKLNEEGETTPASPTNTTAPASNTPTPSTTPQPTDTTTPAKPNETGTIDKLKEANTTNFTQNFYGTVQKKLKAFKPTTGAGTAAPNAQKDVQDVAKTMTGSKNIDSKKNLLKAISNPKLTAGQLADVRDAVAGVLKVDPNTIGKF
jgi:hypothetical protein